MNFKKVLKNLVKWLLGTTLIITIIMVLFMNLSPQFGRGISPKQKIAFEKLEHYKKGKFINSEPFTIKMDVHSVAEMFKNAVSGHPHIRPEKDIEVLRFDLNQLHSNLNGSARVVWLGHSSFLIEMENKVILIDPVFSDFAAPHSLLGKKRYNSEMSFSLSALKKIDAVIISHDHYDHLDYPTIKKIKDKVEHFIVPLGVGNHFEEWGINAAKIQELDWWEETSLGGLKIVLTPSRHSSGRGLNDQSSTLWGSLCFLGQNQKIFFSGDGGYGSHFMDIGNKYGPFDFGMIECGQYDENWKGMHMVPEESVQAGIDAKVKVFMPIHWGAFALANHTWTDPVERFKAKAKELNASISTPSIGQSILVKSPQYPHADWWKKFK